METARASEVSPYITVQGPPVTQTSRVNPNYPLTSPVRPPQSSQRPPGIIAETGNNGNGLARTTSKRRRPSGQGQADCYPHPDTAPRASIAPQASSGSYRDNHGDNESPRMNGSSRSFASRARMVPEDVDSRLANTVVADTLPAARSSRQPRTASLNTPSGNTPQNMQQSSPQATISQVGSAVPQHSQSVRVPRHAGTASQASPYKKGDNVKSPLNSGPSASLSQYGNRRRSEGAVDTRAEWADDRSPLQRLEVKLNDISKEEKRARVQEAEQLLREYKAAKAERRASQKVETERSMNATLDSPRNKEPASTKYGTNLPRVAPNSQPSKRGLPPRSNDANSSKQISSSRPSSYQTPDVQRSATVSERPTNNQSDRRRSTNSTGLNKGIANESRGVRFQGQPDANSSSLVEDAAVSGVAASVVANEDLRPPKSKTVKIAENSSEGDQRRYSQRHTDFGNGDNLDCSRSERDSRQRTNSKLQSRFQDSLAQTQGVLSGPLSSHGLHGHGDALKYSVNPQTSSGIDAREMIGFGSRTDGVTEHPVPTHKHRLSKILHRDYKDGLTFTPVHGPSRRHDDWRKGEVALLTLADAVADLDGATDNKAWWEKKPSNRSKSSTKVEDERLATYDSGYDGRDLPRTSHISQSYLNIELTKSLRSIRVRVPAAPTTFNPPLYLKCGPLLRYTGLKRESNSQAPLTRREIWRGSVMIATEDKRSSHDPVPSLRLFHQHLDLLPPPPPRAGGHVDENVQAEYIDPVAGLPKMSRTGKVVYVKPVDDLEDGVDVSHIETDEGLFEETRTANVASTYGKADELLGRTPLPLDKPRNKLQTPATSGRYREVRGIRLHAEHGLTFWRFNIEVELGDTQARIAYRINNAASIGFWVPARGQTMNTMFHSCNGFSLSVNPDSFSGPDPMWRDVLNSHQTKPFHVMIGGGDQIYNDAVMKETTFFQEWLRIKNPHKKHEAPFTPEMLDELEDFYLDRYCMWFSQGLFGMANSQIPMVNIWDDHDIIDGFGSYPDHFMRSPVFCGLGAVAFKYYMLFQHQSVVDETSTDEPSWLLGGSRGPYINEFSRSLFMFLGKNVAFLGLDCRTERMRDEILCEKSYDLVFDRCRREIIKGDTKHLIVLLGVPIAYPRLVWLENIITSRVMDPVKALGRTGLLGGFFNQFDGGVEILDDLDDHWTARNHKDERNWFVQQLQDLAAEKSVRVTILGGDVHLAAIGQFYSNPKFGIPKDRDFRYMPNVISSAIVNTPPPEVMSDIINKRNRVHHLDKDTDEDMIPMFSHDVDGKSRNNKRLLPRRNWCSIAEYQPGTTPPPTPSVSEEEPDVDLSQRPRNRLQRTFSLTQGNSKPANLLRRLSQRALPRSRDGTPDEYGSPPATAPPIRNSADGYFPSQPKPAISGPPNGGTRNASAPLPTRPVNAFLRRPTNLSEKAVAKGDAVGGEISLEHGLDVCLHCEVDQRDPAGITAPYRLLVPALWYEEEGEEKEEDEMLKERKRKPSLMKRLGSIRVGGRNKGLARNQGSGNRGKGSETESEPGSDDEDDIGDARYGPGRFGLGKRTQGPPPRVQQTTGSVTGSRNSTMGEQMNVTQPLSPLVSQGGPQSTQTRVNGGSQRQINTTQPLAQASPRAQQNARFQDDSPLDYQQTMNATQSLPAQSPPRTLQKRHQPHKNSSPPVQQPRQVNSAEPTSSVSPLSYDEDDEDVLNDTQPVRRVNSKFDASGNSKFFGTSAGATGGSHGGGVVGESGGYSGIEAYKPAKKGWRKLF